MSTTQSGRPKLDSLAKVIADLQPFEPDLYHRWGPGGKVVELLPVSFNTLDGIPDDRDAWWPIYDAWCQYRAYGSDYHRETLLLSMAHRIRFIARSEDQFQTCLKAVWEELGRWITNYPRDCDGEELHADDFGTYLWKVAKNAIHGGRKRKPVQVGDNLVQHVADPESEHERDSDAEAVVKGVCKCPTDEKLLELKQRRVSERDMAAQTGQSPDRVNRDLRRMYKRACGILELKPTPMGRSKRKSEN